MTISARNIAYRNKGEQITLAINLVDDDGEAVTITGDVVLHYRDPDDVLTSVSGSSSTNTAYYVGTAGADFMTPGKYRWWIEVMDNIYGPYELEILDV
jgi:hypothetical protein